MCLRTYCVYPLSTHDRCCSCRCHQLPLLLEMAMATGDAEYRIECCVHGYHVYHWIWYLTIGEVLGTTHEWENEHDRYAVAALEEDTCVFGSCHRSCTPLLRFYDTSQLCVTNPNYASAHATKKS